MPQATDELRAKMNTMFGDPVDDSGPIKFLEDAGYVLNRNWTWKPKPGIRIFTDMTQEEFDCMKFLVDEWDFGWME